MAKKSPAFRQDATPDAWRRSLGVGSGPGTCGLGSSADVAWEAPQNGGENDGKMMENPWKTHGKPRKTMENHGKPWKMMDT